jgi:hypothetical protein
MASEDQLPGFSTRCESLKLSDPGGFSLVNKRLGFQRAVIRCGLYAGTPGRQGAALENSLSGTAGHPDKDWSKLAVQGRSPVQGCCSGGKLQ